MLKGSPISRLRLLVVVACSVLASTAVHADEADHSQPQLPLAIAAVRSIDGLLADIDAVTQRIGRPGFGQIVRGFLVGANDLGGIDRTRPIGLMLFSPSDPDSDPRAMLFIPVSSIDDVQQTLAGLGFASLDDTDNADAYTLQIDRKSLPVRLHAGYAFVVEDERLFEQPLPDAAALAGQTLGDHDVAATLFHAGMSAPLLEKTNRDLQRDRSREMQRKDGESDAEYRLRSRVVEVLFGTIERLVNDFEQVTLRLTYSAGDDLVQIEALLQSRPETRLAHWFDDLKPAVSRFVQIARRPMPLTFLKSSPVPGAIHDLLADVIDLARQELGRELKVDLATGADHPVARLLDAVDATNDQRVADSFLQLINVPTGKMVIVGGIRVAEDDTFSSAIAELVPYLVEAPDVRSVDVNFAPLGGVAFHRIRGTSVRKQEQRVYGPDPALYVGAGKDALWFAVGAHGTLDTLSETLTLPGQQSTRPPALVQLTVHLSRWVPLMESQSGEKARRIGAIARQTFDGHDDDRFTFRTDPVERGLRMRAEWEGGYLRLAGNLLNARDAQRAADEVP